MNRWAKAFREAARSEYANQVRREFHTKYQLAKTDPNRYNLRWIREAGYEFKNNDVHEFEGARWVAELFTSYDVMRRIWLD